MKFDVCIIKEKGGITVAHFPLAFRIDQERAISAVREAMNKMRDQPEWEGEIRVTVSDRQVAIPKCEKDEDDEDLEPIYPLPGC